MQRDLLRAAIAAQGLTQAKLAKLMGINEQSLSRKMLGKRDFRLSEVLQICEILRIDNPKEIFFTSRIPYAQRIRKGYE